MALPLYKLSSAFAITTLAWCQTLTMSPQVVRKDVTVWAAVACAAEKPLFVPTGRVYEALLDRHISFMVYAVAMDRLHGRQIKSTWGKVADVMGYASAGVGIGASTNVFNTSPAIRNKILIGGALAEAVFSIIIPALRAQVPSPLGWEVQLMRDNEKLHPAAGECATGIVLGGPGTAFVLTP